MLLLHIRKFQKNFFAVSYVPEKMKANLQFQLNLQINLINPIKRYNQHILFCIHVRFRFIKQKKYIVPMQNLSTTPKKADLNSEKKRLENHLQVQPKEVTLQKILQFSSTYRAERISENQYVEWYLN